MSHVDSTWPITHVSLCAGYGGIDLGLKRAIPSLRTIAFSEIEAFACANLVAKMETGLLDAAPVWTDLKTFPWSEFHGRVDILSGGYPCQPFSAAGKRLGAEDPRHLWPFIAAGIALMRPGACFFENVEGHCSLGLPDVLQDLAGMGYRTTWCVASASECGAPHQRKRIFILAECRSQRGASGLSRSLAGHEGFAGIADDCGGEGPADHSREASGGLSQRTHEEISEFGFNGKTPWPSRPGEQQYEWEPPRVVVGNAASPRCPRPEDTGADCGDEGQGLWREESERAGLLGHTNSPRPQERPRQQRAGIQGADADGGEAAERQTQPSLGGDTDGLTHRMDDAVLHVSTDNRTDELRLLGNGVCVPTVERAWRVLVGELMEATT